MYSQGLIGADCKHHGIGRVSRSFPGADRPRGKDRTQRPDARRLPPHAGPPDRPACAFGNRRHAARGQLDHPRAVAPPQDRPARQGAGRGRPRPLSLFRRRDAGRLPRADDRGASIGQGQVFLHLQLPDADLGRHRCHRLAGRWRGDHEPDPALPLLFRPLCPRDDPRLQGRKLPPAPGLRDHDDARPRLGRAEADGTMAR